MRGIVRQATGRVLQPGTQYQTLGLVRGVMEGKPCPDSLVSKVDQGEG